MKDVNRDDVKQLAAALKQSGYSVTKARLELFKACAKLGRCQLPQLVNELSGQVNRSSVYRGLELFESLGIVQRINIGWTTQFELSHDFIDHHHHIVCLKCERVDDIPAINEVESAIDNIAHDQGYKLIGHSFELRGLCSDCRT